MSPKLQVDYGYCELAVFGFCATDVPSGGLSRRSDTLTVAVAVDTSNYVRMLADVPAMVTSTQGGDLYHH
jgi:hypothetical protein